MKGYEVHFNAHPTESLGKKQAGQRRSHVSVAKGMCGPSQHEAGRLTDVTDALAQQVFSMSYPCTSFLLNPRLLFQRMLVEIGHPLSILNYLYRSCSIRPVVD